MADKGIVWITGASSGIGKETARLLASAGYRLILSARRPDELEKLKTELESKHPTRVLPLPLDVRNRKAVEQAVSELPEDWKRVDVLVNNAGLAAGLDPVQTGDPDDWEQMIDTNVKGLLYMSRNLLPGMIERKKGHIINLASTAGKEAYENGNVYCATKHAVDALSRGMRIDLLKHGIKVTNIAPGLVETGFSMVRFKGNAEKAKTPYQGLVPLNGRDVAETILFALSRPAHVCINDLVITPTAQANSYYIHRQEST